MDHEVEISCLTSQVDTIIYNLLDLWTLKGWILDWASGPPNPAKES